MTMKAETAVAIDTSSPEPVYEQIVRQIQAGVTSGALPPGAALPSVRQLAGDLLLNRNTVARAYKILEEQGVIQTAGRRGTFVRQHAAREVARLRAGQAQQAFGRLIEALMDHGWSRHEISDAFNFALALHHGKG